MNSSISLFIALVVLFTMSCQAQLSTTYYDITCPGLFNAIGNVTREAVLREPRMAASLVRLHFHDCFVQGCDGSVLLADTATFTGEQTAIQNNNSIRGFEVVDTAKRSVEAICPGVVSCADVLAVMARDATVETGGPTWAVRLGRVDSTTASRDLATQSLPRFSDPLSTLITNFGNNGLSERDMVALSGSHTIGQARCLTFRQRIYNDTNIDPVFAGTRRGQCPFSGGDSNLSPLDLVTPNSFDNNYFRNLIELRGLLASDQVLFNGGSTDAIVQEYNISSSNFAADFAAAMVRMGDIGTVGQTGEIRRICSAVNSRSIKNQLWKVETIFM